MQLSGEHDGFKHVIILFFFPELLNAASGLPVTWRRITLFIISNTVHVPLSIYGQTAAAEDRDVHLIFHCI